ncbi:MAG: ribosome maturation factor RimM [Terriglobia bacterium]
MASQRPNPVHDAREGGAEEPFLAVARILKPQGRRGEVCAEILTDFPNRFHQLRRVFIENAGEAPRELAIDFVWPHKGRMVLKFVGVDSIDGAERLRGRCLLVPFEERIALADNSYYWSELCGCSVVMGSPGKWTEIGAVESVEPTPGVALLHVARKGSQVEVLIPLAEEICTHIDPDSKIIVIDPPENLLGLNY